MFKDINWSASAITFLHYDADFPFIFCFFFFLSVRSSFRCLCTSFVVRLFGLMMKNKIIFLCDLSWCIKKGKKKQNKHYWSAFYEKSLIRIECESVPFSLPFCIRVITRYWVHTIAIDIILFLYLIQCNKGKDAIK